MRATIGSITRWVALITLVSVGSHPVHAGPVRSGFDASALPANDDDSSDAVSMGFLANFFGVEYTHLYVNNNGNITFDSVLSEFTPFELSSTDHAIIAPFFADVDTTGTGSVTYGTGEIDGRSAFGVTWDEVGYFNANTDKLNTFQVVLIDRSDIGIGDFDIEFNYETIQWETGDFSGGVDGFGGASARVGYSNGTGDPGTSFELPGSAEPGAFLDGGPAGTALTLNSLNSEVQGRYQFFARDGVVNLTEPGTSTPEPGPITTPVEPSPAVPEPSSMLLALGGLVASGWYWRRRRQA